MLSSFPAACIHLVSQHPIFTRHVTVGVGRAADEPKSTALSLFLHPSHASPPTYTFLLSLMLHIESILSTSCDFGYCTSYSVACIMLQLFVHLRHPLLFILLLVPLVTMSQSIYYSISDFTELLSQIRKMCNI